jgi:tetratricopeptide (TPR) repeat protein
MLTIPQTGALLLALFMSTQAWCVCLSPTQGKFADYEEIAFLDPVKAMEELAPQFEARFGSPNGDSEETGQLAALLGESARQRDVDDSALAYAERGLAQIKDQNSALGLRLRALRTMVTTAANAAVQVEADNLLKHAALIGEEARACVSKDLVFSMDLPKDFDRYARYLLDAHTQFVKSGNEDERHVVIGRLSKLFVEAGDYESALAMARISRAYFIKRGAFLRASTASLRALPVLYELNNINEARMEAEQGIESAKRARDDLGVLFLRMHLCASEALAKSAAAEQICTTINADLEQSGYKADREHATLEPALAMIELKSGRITQAIERVEREIKRPFRQPGDMLDARSHGLLIELYGSAQQEPKRQVAARAYAEIQTRIKLNRDALKSISADVELSLQHESIALAPNPPILPKLSTPTSAQPPSSADTYFPLWQQLVAGLVLIVLCAFYVRNRRKLLLQELRALDEANSKN